ncbi:hypothetical protein PROFUN_08508 [Planoprotostelium fungivorum]|uniref:Mucoidy inhibitor A n=1 Tax=Planoprotostelium fungivorum TaxID=1890364 RepID=A0A2P6NJB4_9EUKA|nr:hypothetical protein PROFUN_08508 [Planoprotostelium fungivorum]
MDTLDEKKVIDIEASKCPIDSVTVFLDRAEITRTIDVQSSTGTHEVRINGLPNSIVEESIRITGTGEATVLEVSFDWLPKKIISKEGIEAEIEGINKEITDLRREASVLQGERSIVERLSNKIVKGSTEKREDEKAQDLMTPAALQGMTNFLNFYDRNMDRLDTALLESESKVVEVLEAPSKVLQIKEKTDKISELRSQLNQNQPTDNHKRRRVLLSFLTKEEKPIQFHLTYHINGASWSPKYDIRINSATTQAPASLNLTCMGVIEQTTGEDWKEVQLSLSTAAPASSAVAPELTTRTIRYYVPVRYPRRNRAVSTADMCMKESVSVLEDKKATKSKKSMSRRAEKEEECDESEEDAEPEMEVQTATARSNTMSTTFDIPRRSTIDSDGKSHKVTIFILNVSPQLEYIVMPRADPRVFLQATMENTSQHTLLAGSASVFLDNNFIGTSQLSLKRDNSKYAFSLGVDNDIRVKYEAVKTTSSQSGVIRKTREVTVEHKTILSNTKKIPVTLVLHDQLPLSQEGGIKVKLIEPEDLEEANAVLSEHTNIIHWKVQVPAGGSVTVPMKFTVEHPAEKTIEGLDEIDQ